MKYGPLVQGDLMDRAAIDAALAEHRPVAVMHFAAYTFVGESIADDILADLSHRDVFMDSKRASTAYDLGDGANVSNFLLERADGSGERLVTMLTRARRRRR